MPLCGFTTPYRAMVYVCVGGAVVTGPARRCAVWGLGVDSDPAAEKEGSGQG